MNASENLNNINKYKFNMRTIIGIIVIFLIMTTLYMVFADSSVVPEIQKIDGVPYMYFELEHNISNAQYKYYGYGYTVSVYEPGPNGKLLATEYLHNAQFKPYMDGSTEKVWIPMEEIYGMVKLDDEFYSVRNMKVYLNGRLGIKVNGTLTHLYDSYDGEPENGLKETGLKTGYWKEDITVPLNKDGQGIKNGIEHEYGVSWSAVTQKNLIQHFGIPLTVPAVYKYDRYRVEYREVSSKKTVSSEKPYKNFEDVATITEYPVMVNGYEYAGQYMIKKIDTDNNEVVTAPYGDTQQGDSATINIKKNADRYIITFYYTKVDPSTIGNPVTINVEYRENDSNGKKLLDNTSTIGGDLSQFNFNSAKIDDYTCKGHFVMGQATEYFYTTNASFIIGKEEYSKPVNGSLKIIFLYETEEVPEIPKCTPDVDGSSETINITMKRNDFENATEISINNAVLNITKFEAGKDNSGNIVEGTHEFKYFDLYIGSGAYYYMSHDNSYKSSKASFIVPKSIFNQSPTDENIYTTSIKVTYGIFCTCFEGSPDSNGNYGMEFDYGKLNVNITIVENYPPYALYTFYTEKKLLDGTIDKICKAYIGKQTIFENQAYDPNGVDDINYIKYILKDSSNNEFYIKLLQLGSGIYFLDDENVNANNIVFNGVTDEGNIKLKFLTEEKWTISQYVEDMDGLNDTYIKEITPEILNLKPKAIISDAIGYRYPIGVAFGGKQNRVVKYYSTDSYVAYFLQGTGVEINHNRDHWQIIPLEGQDINNLNFESKAGLRITNLDNTLEIKYSYLNTKLQFSEPGKYKIRLQVTDTSGNVSEWAEEIITINEDLKPQITANINSTYLRNSTGIATITIKNIAPKSVDGDYVVMEITDKIKYKYDSDNDNNFYDEATKELTLIPNDSMYEVTLKTSDLGRYQFMLNVRETYGQEYLEEFITEEDYKKSEATLHTHVDNVEPDVTLFEIWTLEN